jgi:hypothetical protein
VGEKGEGADVEWQERLRAFELRTVLAGAVAAAGGRGESTHE